MIRKSKVQFVEPMLAASMVLDRHIDAFIKNKTSYGFSQIKILLSIHKAFACKKSKLCSQSAVAKLWGVSEAAISRQVVFLENDKLITRGLDPCEKRRVILRLTAKGNRLVDKSVLLIDKEMARIFKSVSENTRQSLTAGLAKILQSLSKQTHHYEITTINDNK